MNAALQDPEPKLPDTVAEAVDCLLRELEPADLEQIQRTPRKSLRVYHHEWGPMIQSRFRLDGRNEPLIDDCRRLYALRMRTHFSEFELEQLSAIKSLMPRDSAFVVILEALWDRLQRDDQGRRSS